jgi:hypothetical protein
MTYFGWTTTRRDGQMLGLVEVMLVRELFQWDIHDTPWHLASSNFISMRDIISQHINWGWQMGEPILFHGLKFLVLLRNHKNVNRWFHLRLSPWIIPHNGSIENVTYNGNNSKIDASWTTNKPLGWIRQCGHKMFWYNDSNYIPIVTNQTPLQLWWVKRLCGLLH